MRRSTSWVLVFAVVTMVGACSQEEPKTSVVVSEGVDGVSDEQSVPDEEFEDFMTQESDSGKVTWRLTAPRADRYIKRKLVLLESPVIEFYDKYGKLQTTLEADNGKYSEESRDMVASGNVVVTSVDGDVLETDTLLWNSKTDKIVSDSFVRLTRAGDVLTGWGLEADSDMASVNILRDVEAFIRDDSGSKAIE